MSNEGTIRLRNNSYKRVRESVLDQGFQRRRQNKSVLGATAFDLSNAIYLRREFRAFDENPARKFVEQVAADLEFLWD